MKRGEIWIIFLLALFIAMPAVRGIGLVYSRSYSKLEIPFEPNGQYTLNYKVRANAGVTMDYKFWADGYFADYVTITPEIMKDVPDGSLEPFTVTINFPESVDKYGPLPLKIYAGEGKSRTSGDFGIKTNSYHVVNIMVPYPYLYARVNFEAPDVNEGEPVTFTTTVGNLGEKDIKSATLSIDIFDAQGTKITTLAHAAQSIPSQEEAEYVLVWPTSGQAPGQYRALASVFYDGEVKIIEKFFTVGTLDMKVVNYSNSFVPDKINKMDIIVESRWNSQINDIYAEIKIDDRPLMRTASTSIAPLSQAELLGYFDTSGLKGDYTGEITLFYNDKTSVFPVTVEVGDGEDSGLQIQTPATSDDMNKKPFPWFIVLIVAILVLILIDIIWLISHKKRRHNEAK